MLYYLLKPIVILSLKVFFRKIKVINKLKLPEKGPAILVSNHQSAFIDPLLIVMLLKRKLSFIAGAEWFGNGLKSWIFRKQFNMLPVYRPWLKKNIDKSNKDMFTDVYTSLEDGNCIVIYPEASSVTVPRIRELKTGAVRMKLGAEKISTTGLHVPIIPVGINYYDAHRFRSDLVVKVGDPVDFSDVDMNVDDKELARVMTAKVQDELKEQIVNIENPEHESLIVKVIALFSTTLRKDIAGDEKGHEADFKLEQDVAHAVSHFGSTDPEGFTKIESHIDTYLEKAAAIGLTDDQIDPNTDKNLFLKWITIVMGFPLFLTGVVINAIPYLITRSLFVGLIKPKISSEYIQGKLNPSFTGSLIYALGMFIFVVWTVILFLTVGFTTGVWWLAAIVLVIGYPILEMTLRYIHITQEYRVLRKGRKLRRKYADELKTLEMERQAIIEELKAYRQKYDDYLANKSTSS